MTFLQAQLPRHPNLYADNVFNPRPTLSVGVKPGKYHSDSIFTDQEAEARRPKVTCPASLISQLQSLELRLLMSLPFLVLKSLEKRFSNQVCIASCSLLLPRGKWTDETRTENVY